MVLSVQDKRMSLECLRQLVLLDFQEEVGILQTVGGYAILLLLPEPPKDGKEGVFCIMEFAVAIAILEVGHRNM